MNEKKYESIKYIEEEKKEKGGLDIVQRFCTFVAVYCRGKPFIYRGSMGTKRGDQPLEQDRMENSLARRTLV